MGHFCKLYGGTAKDPRKQIFKKRKMN